MKRAEIEAIRHRLEFEPYPYSARRKDVRALLLEVERLSLLEMIRERKANR